MKKQIEMICEDCFRLVWFDAEKHKGDFLCCCGGHCGNDNYLSRVIALLRNGEKRGFVLGLPCDISDWSPENGVVPAEIPQW